MKRTFALAAFAALIAAPALANPLWWSADRVEDRLDRRDIVVVPHPHWHERRSIRVRVIN